MPISKGEKIFNIINSIFLTAVALFCLAPMIYMLAVSLSDNAQVVAGLSLIHISEPTRH